MHSLHSLRSPRPGLSLSGYQLVGRNAGSGVNTLQPFPQHSPAAQNLAPIPTTSAILSEISFIDEDPQQQQLNKNGRTATKRSQSPQTETRM